jgi:hypothetical protein
MVSAIRFHFDVLFRYTGGDRASGRARVMLFSRQRAARSFIFKKDRNDRALNDRRKFFFAPAGNS